MWQPQENKKVFKQQRYEGWIPNKILPSPVYPLPVYISIWEITLRFSSQMNLFLHNFWYKCVHNLPRKSGQQTPTAFPSWLTCWKRQQRPCQVQNSRERRLGCWGKNQSSRKDLVRGCCPSSLPTDYPAAAVLWLMSPSLLCLCLQRENKVESITIQFIDHFYSPPVSKVHYRRALYSSHKIKNRLTVEFTYVLRWSLFLLW